MRTFDPPQCPHCGGWIEDEYEYNEAQVEFGEVDDPVLLECPSCGEQFEVQEEDVIGEIELTKEQKKNE